MNAMKWVGLIGAVLAGGVGVGCQQYQTYPAVTTARGMAENPNNPNTERAMVAALQYVATRYPPGGQRFEAKTPDEAGRMTADFPFAINVPKGMRKSFYERIATKVGPEVKPLTEEVVADNTLPIYHVTRVWLRFRTGTIDVLRPMPEMGVGPDGTPVYQKVTVRLEGDFTPWRVIHARAWEPGADSSPELYFLPDKERVDQFELSTKPPAPVEVKPAPQQAEAAEGTSVGGFGPR
jgi:hypothetical protein